MKPAKMHTVAQVSAQTLAIQAFLEKCKPGQELSFDRIAAESKVKMDEKGKAYLRSALYRAKIEYSAIVGYGIQLAAPNNADQILVRRLDKIDRSVKRGERTHRNIHEQFFNSLTPDKQREILYVGAIFGAIRVAAANGRLIYSDVSKEKIHTSNVKIPLPQIA